MRHAPFYGACLMFNPLSLKRGMKMPINTLNKLIKNTIVVLLIYSMFVSCQINEVYSSNNYQGGYKENMFVSNPIILSDIPDPDVIRVGNNYYMVSTTMHMTPGVPIMHSTDLVNWRIIGYVYDRLEDNDAHNLKNGLNIYGKGQWAACIRYHKGKFYVLFGSLDTGKTYLFSSSKITGPWERTEINEYLHDPSLLFDDNGKAYIIYGGSEIRVRELTSDLKALNPKGINKVIIKSKIEGLEEGSHAYKINGKYYIITIRWKKGGIREVCVYRSDKIDGPYEGRLALSDTMGYKNNGVAQGGLVDTPDGKWYSMLFQDHDAVGRVPVLVPVRWEDGWPVFGDEKGRVPTKFEKPGKSNFTTEVVKSDEFYQEKPEINPRRFEVLKNTEVTAKEEISVNGDFSRGKVGWKGKDGAKIEVVKETGKNVLHVYSLTDENSGVQQNLTGRIEKGRKYRTVFRIKYTNGPDTAEIVLSAKLSYNDKETYKELVRGYANQNEWVSISGTFEILQDFETISLFIKALPAGDKNKNEKITDYYISYVSIKEILSSDIESKETAPNGSVLGLTWQWNHNPDNSKWSLLERKGFLRLRTCDVVKDIQQARNTLTQRTAGPKCSGWILMDVRNMNDGDWAGLAAFQQEYGFIGVTKQANRFYIVMVEKGNEIAREKLMQTMVYLKVDFDFEIDKAYFYYSYDGVNWTKFGSDLAMRYTIPHFMGYRFAIFNYATKKPGGYVDIDFFKFENKLTGTKTENNYKVYLENETISFDNTTSKTHEVSVLTNLIPYNADLKKIVAVFTHPEWLDVVGVTKVSKLLEKSTVKIVKDNANQTTVIISNLNNRGSTVNNTWERLMKLQLKQKQKLNQSVKSEVLIKLFEIQTVKEKICYGSDSAVTKIEYIAPKEPVGKIPTNANPLIAHKFGADPAVLVYNDRVYVYLTNDILEYDENGKIKDNTYSKINKITVISSDDLVNWTDHGEIEVAGPNGIAKWAMHSWAPAVAYKKINGKDKFFLYFGNGGGGIGVLTADTPIGPWEDPLGRPLITWSTPGIQGVVWLFDPAVLVDDDGKAYIYFGGGVPQGQDAMPNTARVMQLGDDMISVVGEAKVIPAPFMFEDSGINKINGLYYYSYCTNFYSGTRPQGSPPAGVIAYMTSKSPIGPWEYKGVILNNPGYFFGVGGNNHHQLFQFKGKWYIAYHAQTLAKDLGVAKGYRSPHINEVVIEGDKIKEVIADYKGVNQIKLFDPYKEVEAETFAWSAGVETKKANASNNMCLTGIDNRDWIALSKVGFGQTGPRRFEAMVSNVKGKSYIEIRLDSIDGRTIGVAEINPQDGSSSKWTRIETKVEDVTGVHDLYFVFKGENETDLFDMDFWKFVK